MQDEGQREQSMARLEVSTTLLSMALLLAGLAGLMMYVGGPVGGNVSITLMLAGTFAGLVSMAININIGQARERLAAQKRKANKK